MKCLFVLCIYLAACLLLVGAQNCNILTDVEVGNLLPVSLSEGQQDDPMVTVLQTNIVCLVTGTQFGTYQFVSVVVSYNCTGGACPAGTSPFLSQVEFECQNSMWGTTVLGTPDDNVVTGAALEADLTTALWNNCSFCVNPPKQGNVPDSVHHCISCSSECLEDALGRCTNNMATGCCDYVQGGMCVAGGCTAPRTPDVDTFECGLECPNLTMPDGGSITYSPSNCRAGNLHVGCNAMYACAGGAMLTTDPSRSCVANDDNTAGVWSPAGEEPECTGGGSTGTTSMTTDDPGLTTPQIIGIVVGIVGGVLLCAVITIIVMVVKTKVKRKK